jgi:sigma-E factor negative regulatory protein RseC
MEEIGIIKDIKGLLAKVSVPRKNACEGCTAGICKPEEQSMEIEALNPVNASVGQKVRITIKPYTYLRGSIIVYGVPAIALIMGAIFGKEVFSSYYNKLDPDIVSAVVGFVAFIIAFICIKLWSRRVEKKGESTPIIEEILE